MRSGLLISGTAAVIVVGFVGVALLFTGSSVDSGMQASLPIPEVASEQPVPDATSVPLPTTAEAPAATVPTPTTYSTTQPSEEPDFTSGWRLIPEVSIPLSHGGTHVVAADDIGVVVLHSRFTTPTDDVTPGPVGDESSFRVFLSSDGSTWTGGNTDYEGSITSLVAGGPGFMAAGTAENTSVPALWSSQDGVRWDRVAAEHMPQGIRPCDPTDPRLACAITIKASSSSLVVSGYDPDTDAAESGKCAWWLSQDGTSWERMSPPAGASTCVVAGTEGWIAVRGDGTMTGTTDGVAWQERGHLPGRSRGHLWERDGSHLLTARGGNWLAVSFDNGLTWQGADLPVRAQTESGAIMEEFFVVSAIAADGTHYLFHRTLADPRWSATEIVDVPVIDLDLGSFEDRLYAATITGVWEWTPAPGSE